MDSISTELTFVKAYMLTSQRGRISSEPRNALSVSLWVGMKVHLTAYVLAKKCGRGREVFCSLFFGAEFPIGSSAPPAGSKRSCSDARMFVNTVLLLWWSILIVSNRLLVRIKNERNNDERLPYGRFG